MTSSCWGSVGEKFGSGTKILGLRVSPNNCKMLRSFLNTIL